MDKGLPVGLAVEPLNLLGEPVPDALGVGHNVLKVNVDALKIRDTRRTNGHQDVCVS